MERGNKSIIFGGVCACLLATWGAQAALAQECNSIHYFGPRIETPEGTLAGGDVLDFDGDGYLDAVNGLQIFLTSSTGERKEVSYSPKRDSNGEYYELGVFRTDANHDGVFEYLVLAVNADGERAELVSLSTERTEFVVVASSDHIATDAPGTHITDFVAGGYFTQKDVPELILKTYDVGVAGVTGSAYQVYEWRDNKLMEGQTINLDALPAVPREYLSPRDFSGDGLDDLVCDGTGNVDLVTFVDRTVTLFQSLPKEDASSSKPNFGDFDGDGRKDILLGPTLWKQTEPGEFVPQTVEPLAGYPIGRDAGFVWDLNGDGRGEFYGHNYVVAGDNPARAALAPYEPIADAHHLIGARDQDGDGRSDFLVADGNTITAIVARETDIEVAWAAAPIAVREGDPIALTAFVENHSDLRLEGVQLLSAKPKGFSVTSKACSDSGCSLLDLDADSREAVTFEGSAFDSENLGIVELKVDVCHAYADPDLVNNSATIRVPYSRHVDLRARSLNWVSENERFSASFEASNDGPSIAKNVRFTLSIPEGVAIEQATFSPENAVCSVLGKDIECVLEEMPFTTILIGLKGTYSSTASEFNGEVTSDTDEDDPTNNHFVFSVSRSAAGDLPNLPPNLPTGADDHPPAGCSCHFGQLGHYRSDLIVLLGLGLLTRSRSRGGAARRQRRFSI